MVLTLNTSSFEVRLSSYNSVKINDNQIWEVIPCKNSTNVIIRSKYIDSNDSLAKSYYLSSDESSNVLVCKTDKKQKFNISNPTYNWKRFGEIYLSYIGLPDVNQQPESLYFSSMYYYYQNTRNGIKDSNIKSSGINNYKVLYNQNKGSFTKLHFAASKMSDTACEVIATYNALAVTGEYDCYKSGVLTNDIDKFFRLSAEFQLNAMYIINGGWFGSDTSKIGDCLSVYNHGYEVYNENELKMFDAYLRNKKAKGAIVSYDNFGFFNLRIHTFYCYYDAVKNKCIDFNLWGNESDLDEEDFCEESSIEEALNKLNENNGTKKFRIGYILI